MDIYDPATQPPILSALNTLSKLPWERLIRNIPARPGHPIQPEGNKPGCQAADLTILAQGHLRGLARGQGGFGVLNLSRQHLEQAAQKTQEMGLPNLATEMRSIAAAMPQVHDAAAAAILISRLDPIVERTWRLGRICGLSRQPQRAA